MNSKWMKLVCSKIFGQRRQISSWFINGNQDKYQELRNSILCVKILGPCHVQPQNSSSLTLMWAANSSLSCTLANNKTIRQKYHIYRSKYHFTFFVSKRNICLNKRKWLAWIFWIISTEKELKVCRLERRSYEEASPSRANRTDQSAGRSITKLLQWQTSPK